MPWCIRLSAPMTHVLTMQNSQIIKFIMSFLRNPNLKDLLVKSTTPLPSTHSKAGKKTNSCHKPDCIYCVSLNKTGKINSKTLNSCSLQNTMGLVKATTLTTVWPAKHVSSNMSAWQTESFRNASDNISATSETQTCVTLLPNTLTSQVITMTQEMWNPTFFPLLPSQVIPAWPWPWDSSLSYSGFFAYATWSEFHGLINQSRHVSCRSSPVD